jgi:predicted transposase YbfD/YdcC
LKDGHILERVTAIDGKTVRGSKGTFHNKSPLHSVHARGVENGICLPQMECGEKTGEMATVPQVPELLEIKGSIITVDAMGTQRETAHKTVENGGDCIPAVKGSQGRLEEEIHAACKRNSPVPDTGSAEKGHGRIGTRRCEVFEKGLTAGFENRREKLTAVIKIASIREFGDKTGTRERFYTGSLNPGNSFNRYIRDHRAVENNQHRRLDTAFREDEQRKRPATPLKILPKSEKLLLICSEKIEKARSREND